MLHWCRIRWGANNVCDSFEVNIAQLKNDLAREQKKSALLEESVSEARGEAQNAEAARNAIEAELQQAHDTVALHLFRGVDESELLLTGSLR